MDTWREKLSGFYAVLDTSDEAQLGDLLAVARVLQVRIKPETPVATGHILAVAALARARTREAGALLVVNDRLDVAVAAAADGVHLGQDDLPLEAARRVAERLCPERRLVIGISTHDLSQVAAARRGGADYIGFGPVYETSTKRNPDPVRGIERLAAAVREAGDMPVVAIGGITPDRAAEVAHTGAAAACCISAVNAARDRVAAARRVAAPFMVRR